jgi:hypothetical protein
MQLIPHLIPRACLRRRAARTGPSPSRELAPRDEGSIVIVAVLTVALAIVSTVSVVSVVNGLDVASTATFGEQAVAQANAGVSDALFRLDQMGGDVSSFCEGIPPSGVPLPSGVTSWVPPGVSACSPATGAPLSSDPNLEFYAVSAISNQRASIVAVAKVSGQVRTITTDVYQLVDDFGIYALSNLSFNGNGQATVAEVDSQGNVISSTSTQIDVGIGASGVMTCAGGLSDNVYVISGPKAQESGCNPPKGVINVSPQDPQVCTAGQSTLDAFTPCLDAGPAAFALDPAGNPYCPLPGVSGLAVNVDYYVPVSPPDGAATTYDCDTAGGQLTISSSGSSQPIPEGNYYITSNTVTLGSIDPSAFSGPVSLYILPAACYPGGDPITGASGYASGGCEAGSPAKGDASTSDPNCSTTAAVPAQSLTMQSSDVNGTVKNPGNPENLNVYWSGCGNVPIGVGANTAQFVGNFYAPGASITANSHFGVLGSILVGVLTSNGSPTIEYYYAEHQSKLLQGWTELNYHIST